MDRRVGLEFEIALTFQSVSNVYEEGIKTPGTRNIFEASLVESKVSCLECWDSPSIQTSGIALGCEDGTIYVLRNSATPSSLLIGQTPLKYNDSKRARSSRSRSGSASPTTSQSILSPTFNVTARPRVVSGVNREQVEAPKNYVDFEDEPDKLKDILKGKNPREKPSPSESGSERDRTPRSSVASVIEPAFNPKRRSGPPRSLLSATNSRAPTPPVFSGSSSPNEYSEPSVQSTHGWTLHYHIIPTSCGSRHAVTCMQYLNHNQQFAVLQASGNLYVFSTADGHCTASFELGREDPANHPILGIEIPKPQDTWIWSGLTIYVIGESIILLATASNESTLSAVTPDTEQSPDNSRCVMLELEISPSEIYLKKLAQFDLHGPAKSVGIYKEEAGTFAFFSTSHDGHFIVRELVLRSPLPSASSVKSDSPANDEKDPVYFSAPNLANLSALPIPNALKSMISRSSENLLEGKYPILDKHFETTLSEPHDAGVLITNAVVSGLRVHHCTNGKLYGLAWSHQQLCVFVYFRKNITAIVCSEMIGVEDAEWVDQQSYLLFFEDRAELYHIKTIDPNNEEIYVDHFDKLISDFHAELVRVIRIEDHNATKLSHGQLLVSKLLEETQQHCVLAHSILNVKGGSKTLWRTAEIANNYPLATPTFTFPLEFEFIIQGYSDGFLRRFSLSRMTRRSGHPWTSTQSSLQSSNTPISGKVLDLHVVQNPRTRERYVVGGGDDGSIAFWSLNNFELLAFWVIFNTPLVKVIQLENEIAGPLRGCVLCIARDGTIAVIIIDGFHFRYLIPGAVAPLKRICLGGSNLMLIYSDHHARLWDAQTKELWRSFGEDKVEELLGQGGWLELLVDRYYSAPKTVWESITDCYVQDASSSLVLKLEKVIVDAISVIKTISTSRDEVREIMLARERLQFLLSTVLTPGLNTDIDSICYGKLGAVPASTSFGLPSYKSTTLIQSKSPQDIWCISASVSASRALAIISILRAMSLFEDLMEGANTVIAFYASAVGACVGSRFKHPNLELLGQHWLHASNEFRQPIRTLFDATISNLSDEELMMVVERWQHYVPTLLPDAEKESENAVLALLICGSIAAHKYTLISINTLIDISKSISLYLNNDKSIYRILAIDLCSRGFTVWQNYIDAMEILRSLFDLAASLKKDNISIQNLSAQSRLAILSIASSSMPIFLGTLCLDILTPPNVDHQRAVLHVLAFLIKKRPHILQSSLPRLMEAVVKSLDPNSTANRELVLDTATEIIGFVVKTFPTVDFHMATQRLAVGTNEGAVVMYDLKTAIRLYVLEGHKKQITACSFSPDGRRLVTISLKDSSVLVWKVGSSFASFFNPGAPPRQGHGGSEPFKTINFNVGSEAEMTTADTLDLVRVEWIADRSVRIKIRQSVMTFST